MTSSSTRDLPGRCVPIRRPGAGEEAEWFLVHMRQAAPALLERARLLTRSPPEADDLLQEVLLQAWRDRARLRREEDAQAWFAAILEGMAPRARPQPRGPNADGPLAAHVAGPEDQELSLRCSDTLRALARLPPMLKRPLEQMVAGASYEEAARACSCRVGTFKSRLTRAREVLAEVVNGSGPDGRTVVW